MVNPKELDPSESPWTFYGAELRRLREAAGLSQDKLGELVYCSGSYIGQIEVANRKPQIDLSQRMDVVLKTGGYLTRLCKMVLKASRLAAYFLSAAELEAMANAIREYAPLFVPGLLQTEAYARAVFLAAQPLILDSELNELVAARLARGCILDRPKPSLFWAILDEAVIRRPVGGPAVMREQLRHILELSAKRRIIVQVLPLAAGAPALGSMAKLMMFDDAPPTAYIEGVETGCLLDEPAMVARCELKYDLMQAASLSPEASRVLIESAIEELRP